MELFAEPGGDFVAVHRCVAGWQIDHRFQADGAVIAEWGVEPVQQNGADVFDPGDAEASAEGFFAEVDVDDSTRPGPVGVERRRADLQ